MSASTEYDSLGIVVPAQWVPLPLERPDFDRFCGELRRRWADEGWDRTTQRRSEILLARIRRDLERRGIQYAAMYAGPGDGSDAGGHEPPESAVVDDDDRPAGEVMLATCVVGTYSREDLEAKVPLTLGNLVIAFGRKPPADRDFSRISNLEPPAMHRLPLGAAVRLRRVYKLRRPGALPDRFFGESYLIPLGEDGERCVICHFVTPNITAASLFSELFVDIAGTLRGWTPDEATSYVEEWVDPPAADDDVVDDHRHDDADTNADPT